MRPTPDFFYSRSSLLLQRRGALGKVTLKGPNHGPGLYFYAVISFLRSIKRDFYSFNRRNTMVAGRRSPKKPSRLVHKDTIFSTWFFS